MSYMISLNFSVFSGKTNLLLSLQLLFAPTGCWAMRNGPWEYVPGLAFLATHTNNLEFLYLSHSRCKKILTVHKSSGNFQIFLMSWRLGTQILEVFWCDDNNNELNLEKGKY